MLIAEPETAMLDFKGKKKDVFRLSYRFQNLNILKKRNSQILPEDMKERRFLMW